MNVFSVVASILSGEELGAFAIDKYGLNKNSSCQLLRTGINHTYLISENDTKYTLRVYSHNWRSKKEISEEIRLLLFLKDKNVNVSFPIQDRKGEFIQELIAPEGLRYAVLFSYANGKKVRYMDTITCTAVGSLMGQIHVSTSNKEIKRIHYNRNSLLELPYQHAGTFFSEKLPEMEFIKDMCKKIGESFEQSKNIQPGIVHMDIWYDNMSITDKNEITLFDFDFCGTGFLVLDIAYFCKQLFHIETDKYEYKQKVYSFLEGYQKLRSLSKEEIELIPYAGAAIWIFYLGVQSSRFDWSNIFLTENYLKMYVDKMKFWIQYHNK
jgi:Ser/Thr protein kinase RdoA (MazF antagonist)